MNHENPTPLRVGATGTLNGWRVRVAARLVMGMEDGGETYHWNEFHLVDDSGNSAMLVFEETEDGAEWKLFREFTPPHPITAREAASKRVGDRVDLDGTPTRITLVDQSRVLHIEGRAPEGVEVGDVADYFNIDTGGRMLVASWSGDEIEFYEGLDAPADSVADAFNIPRETAPGTAGYLATTTRNSGSGTRTPSRMVSKIVLGLFGVASLFATYSCVSGHRALPFARSGPPPRKAVPPLQLPTGAKGSLAQHSYVIDSHTVVEVARVAGRHDRREYGLRDEANGTALLVNGLSGGSKEWHLFRPLAVPTDLSPYDAATKRKGAPVNLEGRTLRVTDLFQSTPRSTAGPGGATPRPPAVQYGFVAQNAGEWLVARWTENQIQFLHGTSVPEADVLTALRGGPEKAR